MARLEFFGKVDRIGETVQVATNDGSRTFFRRELVINATTYDRYTAEEHKNFVSFEFGGNKCTLLDSYKPGDQVVVNFVLQGVDYVDKTTGAKRNFTKVVGYDIRPMEQQRPVQQPSQSNPAPVQAPQPTAQPITQEEGEQVAKEDLPF